MLTRMQDGAALMGMVAAPQNPIELPYEPAIPLLDIHPREVTEGTPTDGCIPTFRAALFTTAKRWEQPKGPSTHE